MTENKTNFAAALEEIEKIIGHCKTCSQASIRPDNGFVRTAAFNAKKALTASPPEPTAAPCGHVVKGEKTIVTYLGTSKKPTAGTEREKKTWRCFHCDEVFYEERCASDHFGRTEFSEAACIIKAGSERSMLTALRRAEENARDMLAQIHAESTDAAKGHHALMARHTEQLRVVEENAYERGLHDGLSQPEAQAGDVDLAALKRDLCNRFSEAENLSGEKRAIIFAIDCLSASGHLRTKAEPDPQFTYATTADLSEALGFSKNEAQSHERGVNAILRRGEIKTVNDPTEREQMAAAIRDITEAYYHPVPYGVERATGKHAEIIEKCRKENP